MAITPNPPSGPEIDVDPRGVTIDGNSTTNNTNSNDISPLAAGAVKNSANQDITLDVSTFQVQLKAGSPVNVAWVQFVVGPATVRIEKDANNKIAWKLNGGAIPHYAAGTNTSVFPAALAPNATTTINYGTAPGGTGTAVPASNFKTASLSLGSPRPGPKAA